MTQTFSWMIRMIPNHWFVNCSAECSRDFQLSVYQMIGENLNFHRSICSIHLRIHEHILKPWEHSSPVGYCWMSFACCPVWGSDRWRPCLWFPCLSGNIWGFRQGYWESYPQSLVCQMPKLHLRYFPQPTLPYSTQNDLGRTFATKGYNVSPKGGGCVVVDDTLGMKGCIDVFQFAGWACVHIKLPFAVNARRGR